MDGPAAGVTATTRVAGVIGDPIRHSLSPVMFNAAFAAAGLDWVYVAFEVPAGATAAALDAVRTLGIDGLSVTMPHKTATAVAVDELTPTAAALGAVNCVTRRADGSLEGDNTDGEGFLAAARAEGCDPAGASVAVLGAGGAARAVILALAGAGAAEVVVVNRTRARAVEAAALAPGVGRAGIIDDVGRAEVVVNATSVGMAGQPGTPVPPAMLRPDQVVIDLVYHPAETALLRAAGAAGARAIGGIGMLVHQGAAAFSRWTGSPAPLASMDGAARAVLEARAGAG